MIKDKLLLRLAGLIISGVLAVAVFAGCGDGKNSAQQSLTVAVSANFQAPFEKLASAYRDSTGKSVQSIVSSSGKLTTQIRNGAPFDLFFSADTGYPNQLFRDGLALRQPQIYASGKLVIWFSAAQPEPLDMSALTNVSLKAIAVANPQIAPYGAAAVTALKNAGIYNDIEPKLVFGRNVAQVNQYLFSGAADAAITAQSAVVGSDVPNSQWAFVDSTLYQPIAQAAMIIANRPAQLQAAAAHFLNFLNRPVARNILQNYGYQLP